VHHQFKDRIEVVREYGDLPQIDCAPNQLNQVFMNLLVNAAQAIEDKGTVTIRTWVDNGQVNVQIVDTGKGNSSEHMEHIFDPGWTTKSRGVGTGLGLSISYNIVENHGGKLLVESMPGAGATFTVHLPIEA
jgi:signal transduction histidine kinase